jgi:hypothetical protein
MCIMQRAAAMHQPHKVCLAAAVQQGHALWWLLPLL